MAVTLRLARHGQKKRPYYRIVAAEHSCRRDGRFIEIVGTFNPLTEPPQITLKEDRVKHWVGVGAQTSQQVSAIIKKQIPGLIEQRIDSQRSKVQQRRKDRKERATARAA